MRGLNYTKPTINIVLSNVEDVLLQSPSEDGFGVDIFDDGGWN